MNPKIIECARNAYLSAWEIGLATGSTSATSGSNNDASDGNSWNIWQHRGFHRTEECRKDTVEVPKAQSYGGVLFSADRRVLLREPLDHLAGYVWTWPKGKPEMGETAAQTALREVHEETGYRARIIGVLPKVYLGTTRITAFFLMAPVGEQERIINETAQTRWVSYEEACKLISLNKHAIGRNRDRAILDDALQYGPAANPRRMPISVRPNLVIPTTRCLQPLAGPKERQSFHDR